MLWYYRLLSRRPYLVLFAIGFISILCIVLSVTLKPLPDFSDPTLGFEARGTSIGERLTAWQNLLEATRPSGNLIANPAQIWQSQRPPSRRFHPRPRKNQRKNRKHKHYPKKRAMSDGRTNDTSEPYSFEEESEYYSAESGLLRSNEAEASAETNVGNEDYEFGHNKTYIDEDVYNRKLSQSKERWDDLQKENPPSEILIPTTNFFCDNPNPDYAHFVVKRVDHNLTVSLFEINGLLAMCDLEFHMTQIPGYAEMCENVVGFTHCCQAWSLPNYVALLSNRQSCMDLKPEDVVYVSELILYCAEYYRSLKLASDCATTNKCKVPRECIQHNAVYNILHYIIDTNAVVENATTIYVNVTMIFIPIAKTTKALPLYYEIEKKPIGNQLVAVVAIDMGLKAALFDDFLLRDCWLLGLAGIFIMLCMYLYTQSLVLTIMTFIAIGFSLGTAYFFYTTVFMMPFFPFMNLLAVIVIVGIGADDAFIYWKVWNCALEERELVAKATGSGVLNASRDTLSPRVQTTMKHATISMGVTSLTTAVAFFSSALNSITAVKCFGIFAGTAVMCNYFMMITWLPASITLTEKINRLRPVRFCTRLLKPIVSFINRIGTSVEDFFIHIVVQWTVFWVCFFGAVGLGSAIVIFWWPRLQLPDTPDFKLFDADHPFELYESDYRNMFWFEKLIRDTETLPIRFVWGVVPADTGNSLNPSSRGTLVLDDTLNISSQAAQQWLMDFCLDIKYQPFYKYTHRTIMPSNCFIENIIRTMDRQCIDPMSFENHSPCCKSQKFPYEPHVFERCLPHMISILFDSPRYVYMPGVAGPKFGKDTVGNGTFRESPPVVQALIVEFESNQSFSMSYPDLAEFEKSVMTWFEKKMLTAPVGMQKGWFVSELGFYDLQYTLSQDTIYSIILAMGVSLAVLILVTGNLVLSLMAIVTVTFTIFSTIAILVLMGWKLNVLESIAISSAIGLTLDFSLHYANSYRRSRDGCRKSGSQYALANMIGPTAMAALTTGAAGAFMVPSMVLAYVQIGKFLVIVMCASWLFASLFLMSALRLFGPQHGFGELRHRRRRRNRLAENSGNAPTDIEMRSSQCTATDQLMSPTTTSGASDANTYLPTPDMILIDTGNVELESQPLSFDRAIRHDNDVPIHIDSSPSSTCCIADFSLQNITADVEFHHCPEPEPEPIERINELEVEPLNFERAIRRNPNSRPSSGLVVVESIAPSVSAISGSINEDDNFVEIPLKQ